MFIFIYVKNADNLEMFGSEQDEQRPVQNSA
jgi:hypothetical protein